MDEVSDITVRSEGHEFVGWDSITVSRNFAQAAGVFRLGVAPTTSLPLQAGSRVEILVGDEPVMTGYVDAIQLSGGPGGSKVEIGGRSLAADLVDCSTEREGTAEWYSATIQSIVEDVARPFGVPTKKLTGPLELPIDYFAVNRGESAWATIERMLRLRGMTAYSAGDGTLAYGRPNPFTAGVSLELARTGVDPTGVPVETWSVREDHSSRFGQYLILAQHYGTDDLGGYIISQVAGSSLDESVRRYRPLEVLAEGVLLPAEADERARTEAIVRATRSFRVQVSVPGWRRPSVGFAWDVNLLVRTVIYEAGLDEELFVDAVTFTVDEGSGVTTALELVRADAYNPDAAKDGVTTGIRVVPQSPWADPNSLLLPPL